MDSRAIYYEEPYLRRLVARVTAITDSGVVLDQTICYPEGGGQGGDQGTIAGCRLLDTKRAKDGTILHVVEEPTFAEGDEVEILLDWERRYHFMRLHTAQHMASGLLYQRWAIGTVSVHLGERVMMIECDADQIRDQIAYELEDALNAQVLANHPVSAEIHSRASAEALGLRRSIKVEGEQIRLVTVQDVDTIACGGLHVDRTAEIEYVLYMGQERMRGHVRLIFTVASAAKAQIRQNAQIVDALGTLFSAPPEELVDSANAAVAAFQHERSEHALIRERLASLLLSGRVADAAQPIGWEVDEPIALKEIGQAVAEHESVLLCAVKGEEHGRFGWLIAAKGAGAERFDFKAVRDALFIDFGAKGGGRPPLYQGSATGEGRRFIERFMELLA